MWKAVFYDNTYLSSVMYAKLIETGEDKEYMYVT